MSWESQYEEYQEKNHFVQLLGVKENERKYSYVEVTTNVVHGENGKFSCEILEKTNAVAYVKEQDGKFYVKTEKGTDLSKFCTLLSKLKSIGCYTIIATFEDVTIECIDNMRYQSIFNAFCNAKKLQI